MRVAHENVNHSQECYTVMLHSYVRYTVLNKCFLNVMFLGIKHSYITLIFHSHGRGDNDNSHEAGIFFLK